MGRKPVGPELAERVEEASPEARRRLKVVLQTLTGEKTTEQACQELGLHKSMLFKLRKRVIQAGAKSLEAQRIGRPPREVAGEDQRRIAELEAENRRLETELQASKIRVELALALPSRGGRAAPAQKKTTRREKRRPIRLRNPCPSLRPRTSKFSPPRRSPRRSTWLR